MNDLPPEALEALAALARRSRHDGRLPEDKRSGLVLVIQAGGEPESGETEEHEAGESEAEELLETD